MKSRNYFIPLVMIAWSIGDQFIAPAFAREAPIPLVTDQPKGPGDAAFWSHLGTLRKTTELLGLEISDRAGHRLGKVLDLVIDPAKGRSVCALVLPPGGDPLAGGIPVPAPALFVSGRSITLTGDGSILTEIPTISPGVTDPAELGKAAVHAYAYFNLKYAREDQGQGAGVQLWRSSRLIGRKVKGKSGEALGSLQNLMVDLRSGHVFYAICTLDGSEKNVYATPPSALTVDRQEPTLLIDADRAKVDSTSNSDGFLWTSLLDPAWGANVYTTYAQTPNSETEEAGPARTDASTGATVKAGPTDAELNTGVLTAFMRAGLAEPAYRYVSILISSGKVTLQGKVRNESTKQKVIAAAEGVVGPGNVTSLLAIGR